MSISFLNDQKESQKLVNSDDINQLLRRIPELQPIHCRRNHKSNALICGRRFKTEITNKILKYLCFTIGRLLSVFIFGFYQF